MYTIHKSQENDIAKTVMLLTLGHQYVNLIVARCETIHGRAEGSRQPPCKAAKSKH